MFVRPLSLINIHHDISSCLLRSQPCIFLILTLLLFYLFVMAWNSLIPGRRTGLALLCGVIAFAVLGAAYDAVAVGELSVGEIEDELQVFNSLPICGALSWT